VLQLLQRFCNFSHRVCFPGFYDQYATFYFDSVTLNEPGDKAS